MAKTELPDRHTLDEVARAVVTGERGLGRELDRLADDMAGLMRNCLAASEAPGFQRVDRGGWNAPCRWQGISVRYGSDLVRVILARVDKHLAALTRKAKDA